MLSLSGRSLWGETENTYYHLNEAVDSTSTREMAEILFGRSDDQPFSGSNSSTVYKNWTE